MTEIKGITDARSNQGVFGGVHLHVEGEDVFANPFDLATVPAARLGAAVGVLAERDQDMIIRALDELVSRA